MDGNEFEEVIRKAQRLKALRRTRAHVERLERELCGEPAQASGLAVNSGILEISRHARAAAPIGGIGLCGSALRPPPRCFSPHPHIRKRRNVCVA